VQNHHQNILQKLSRDLFITYLLIKRFTRASTLKKGGKSEQSGDPFLTLKFGNHSLTPSNGLGIAATCLNTNRYALSCHKVFLLRPYSLING
jgi:hypothetical protein